jgi:hypothetical protein
MCKFQNNTSVSKNANRGGGEASRASLDIADTANWNEFASSSSITEQALSAWLIGLDQHGQRPWPGKEAEGGVEEEVTHQSPRCSSGWHGRAGPARPARGCLGTSSPGCSGEISCNASTRGCSASTREEARRGIKLEAIGGGRSRGVESPRSPRGGGARWFHLVELVEGAGAHVSPGWQRRSSPELAGEARRRRWRSSRQRDRGRRRAKAGLGRFDRPRTWPVGLDPAGVAGLGHWASGPKPFC